VDRARGQAPRGEVVRQVEGQGAATSRVRRDLAEVDDVPEVCAAATAAAATGRVATAIPIGCQRRPMRPGDADDATVDRGVEGLEHVDAGRQVGGVELFVDDA